MIDDLQLAAATAPDCSSEAPAERRAKCRFHTVMRVAKVTRENDVGLWRVRNISDEGMMMLTSVPVAPGERMKIALSDSVAIEARAVWWDGQHCGVGFAEPIDCAAVLKTLVAEQRGPNFRPLRLPVSARALVYCERGTHAVRIRNVSQHGASVVHHGCFKEGMSVTLLLENGHRTRGLVRWSKDDRAGLFLHEPFPSGSLESVARFA